MSCAHFSGNRPLLFSIKWAIQTYSCETTINIEQPYRPGKHIFFGDDPSTHCSLVVGTVSGSLENISGMSEWSLHISLIKLNIFPYHGYPSLEGSDRLCRPRIAVGVVGAVGIGQGV